MSLEQCRRLGVASSLSERPIFGGREYCLPLLTGEATPSDTRAVPFRGRAVTLVVVGVFAWAASAAFAHPTSGPKTIKGLCFLLDVKGSVIHFSAADGTKLVGATAGTGATGVLIANTWGDFNLDQICDWVGAPRSQLVNGLIAGGMRILLFDYRRVGFSQKRPGAWGQDLLAAAAELRRLGARRIVILSESTGALVTFSVASQLGPSVKGLVSLNPSGYPTATATNAHTGGPVDGMEAIKTFKLPLLFLVMRGDTFDYPPTKMLYDAATVKDKQLIVFSGRSTGNTNDIFTDPSRLTRILDATLTFIRKHAT